MFQALGGSPIKMLQVVEPLWSFGSQPTKPGQVLARAKALSSNAVSTSSRYHHGTAGRQISDDYEIFPEAVLGEGSNGPVVVAKSLADGRRCALKSIRKASIGSRALKKVSSEVEIHLAVDHPNVARLRDVYETASDVKLITECCDGGELYARLHRVGHFSEAKAKAATTQMLRAVAYLHSHSIAHRDLKLENFVYESTEALAELKLIDFGFAKVLDHKLMKERLGTTMYASPEVIKSVGYTSKCDMWSVGVITFMMLAGRAPFCGEESKICEKIKQGKVDWFRSKYWKSASEDTIDFVRRLLEKDPDKRLDADEALSHRWLSSLKLSNSLVVLPAPTLRALQSYAQASRLQRAVLQLLSQELAPEEIQELRNTFLRLGSGHKGTIGTSELQAAILAVSDNSAHGKQGDCEASPLNSSADGQLADQDNLRLLLKVLDANGDEQIYYSDFIAATMGAKAITCPETLRGVFSRLDADRSGTISERDFKSVIGETFEGVDVHMLVQELDSSNNGEIAFDDFEHLLQEYGAQFAPPDVNVLHLGETKLVCDSPMAIPSLLHGQIESL